MSHPTASRRIFAPFLVLTCSLSGLAFSADPVGAQAESGEGARVSEGAGAGDGWNARRALELIEGARRTRQTAQVDSTLSGYSAEARGWVYFFFDREDSETRNLVKTDQVALRVHWQTPDRVRQEIVGLRDEEALPTDIQYHLDHLTVVQNEFDDVIRMGDGDEVSAVTHPAARGSEAIYDFRLADSLTLRLPGAVDPIRVYQVEVRPKDFGVPAIVGSLFIDRASASIVRMSFTFTPASYVDDYLDYIRVSLENGLWEGKYWLPYRQEAELRREVPFLDLDAGSIIRARFRVGDYTFNPEFEDDFFRGPRVTAPPERVRRAFDFEEPLYADLEEAGLTPPPSLEELRSEARRIAQDRALSGLDRLRLHLPDASSVLRYNRAEGAVFGAGVSLRPTGLPQTALLAGWSFGREEPFGRVTFGASGREALRLSLFWDEPRDRGPAPASAGVLNTLAATFADEDWQDLWFVRGGALGLGRTGDDGVSARATLRFEKHRSAARVVDDLAPGRPVIPAEEGTVAAAEATVTFEIVRSLQAEIRVGGGRFVRADDSPPTSGHSLGDDSERGFLETGASLRWSRRRETGRKPSLRIGAEVGTVSDGAPEQAFALLGGRGTVPGHPFRRYLTGRWWWLHGTGSADLAAPWLRLRLLAAAAQGADRRVNPDFCGPVVEAADAPTGLTGQSATSAVPAGTACDLGLENGTDGAITSVGVGVGLLWDVLHLDLHRGFGGDGADWEWVFSVSHRFHEWL